MTEEQIEMLRRLIQDEIEVAGVDSFEHGVWGWMDSQLDKRWKQFQDSFNETEQLKKENAAMSALNNFYSINNDGLKRLAQE